MRDNGGGSGSGSSGVDNGIASGVDTSGRCDGCDAGGSAAGGAAGGAGMIADVVPAGKRRVRVQRRHPPPTAAAAAAPTTAQVSPPKTDKTDVWCWHCCHPFDTLSLPLPVAYDDRRDVFRVMGTFCSWACMKAFNLESRSYLTPVVANVITLFRKRCTGALKGIRPAPPRIALRVFGGRLTIEEFRAAAEGSVEHVVLPPRMVEHELVVTQRDAGAATRNRALAAKAPPDLAAVVDFKHVSTKNETLRLKRSKPMAHTRNQLEQAMGLTIAIAPAPSESPTAKPQ